MQMKVHESSYCKMLLPHVFVLATVLSFFVVPLQWNRRGFQTMSSIATLRSEKPGEGTEGPGND
jgi:hypothetical protein